MGAEWSDATTEWAAKEAAKEVGSKVVVGVAGWLSHGTVFITGDGQINVADTTSVGPANNPQHVKKVNAWRVNLVGDEPVLAEKFALEPGEHAVILGFWAPHKK